MRIALDAQHLLGAATGIGEYTRGLQAALERAGVQTITLAEPLLDPWRFDRRVVWDQLVLPLRAAAAGADLLHCTSGTMPIVSRVPTVVTVHDLAWLRVQRHARWYARAYFGRWSLDRYKSARAIIADSAFTRAELLALTSLEQSAVRVVWPGVDPAFSSVVRTPGEGPLVLAVGTVERRKNLEVVIRALARTQDVQLLSVGPATPYRATCEALARELSLSDRVRFSGYVTRAELLSLYARASVAVAPSTYEGFGYAAAQALCAGVPLVAADSSSLREIVSGDAPLVAPHDVDGWRVAIAGALADVALANERAHAVRSRAVQRFSWDASAAATVAVYRDALG